MSLNIANDDNFNQKSSRLTDFLQRSSSLCEKFLNEQRLRDKLRSGSEAQTNIMIFSFYVC
jgi:hypothetical protein